MEKFSLTLFDLSTTGKPQRNTPAPAGGQGDDKSAALDLYKLEYERGSMRYDSIYQALWQNFSYLALVSGAILTFGKDVLGGIIAAFCACLPLIFWFWAAFVPLNKYGDQVASRLCEIEKVVNEEFGLRPAGTPPRSGKGLQLYQQFVDQSEVGNDLGPRALISNGVKVVFFVAILGTLVPMVWPQAGRDVEIIGLVFMGLFVLSVVWRLLVSRRDDTTVRRSVYAMALALHLVAITLLIGFGWQVRGASSLSLPQQAKPTTTVQIVDNPQQLTALQAELAKTETQLSQTLQQVSVLNGKLNSSTARGAATATGSRRKP